MNANRGHARPRRAGRGGGGLIAVYPVKWYILAALVGVVWRFLAGQVVTRRPGRWDARYLTWAAVPPDNVVDSREAVPRSRWAKRPGYQRQLMRAAALVALVGYDMRPTLTLWIVVGLVAIAIARSVIAAHRRHLYAPITATWWDYVAQKIGATGDAFDWVTFRTREIRWERVTPLAALVRPRIVNAAGTAPDGPVQRLDRGGLLTRWVPWLAAPLRPLTCPIGETTWVLRRRAALAGQTSYAAAVTARSLERFVVVVEASRAWRVVPRPVRYDLGSDDARIEIHYPATYPAHPQDIAEIQRVLRERLPARTPDPAAPLDVVDAEDEDAETVAALPVGAWTARNDNRHLRIVFERSKIMPADVQITRHIFEAHPLIEIPIGVEVTRRGRPRMVVIPLKAKTPHISIAASTGWGKTTIANVAIGHVLYHGGYAILMDPKEIGFIDAYRNASPNIEIRTTVDGWVDAYKRVLAEMNRRYRLMNECADRINMLGLPKMHQNPELYFQPLILLEDEKGSLTTAIIAWWKEEGEKGDPPPFSWIQQILWRGRQAAVHVITCAQQNNARVFLNTDMRDQYMMRILAGPQTHHSWGMTFPGVKKRSIPKKKGRGMYGVGPEEPRELQLGRISDDEARAAAVHGIGVAERDNQARAELLAQAAGRPVWEVSPLPYWVRPPAHTASGVPGQAPSTDTSQGAPERPERPLALVRNGVSADSKNHFDMSDDETVEAQNGGTGNAAERMRPDEFERPAFIVGEAAAAEFLGISLAAFSQRRKRAKKGSVPTITGEIRVGKSPAWPPLELAEWNNQFRSAS